MSSCNNIPGYYYATIGDKAQVSAQTQLNVYHGTCLVDVDCYRRNNGLPKRGGDIDLIRHAEPPPTREEPSAFIGTVPFPNAPGFKAGAVYWADDGGFVYHIKDWPGYDINCLLEGRIPDGKNGFRGPKNCGEQEIAIPAAVPLSNICKVGKVEKLRGGLVVKWINP